jgi:hypothetical protein
VSTLRHHTIRVVSRAGRTAPDTRRPASDPLQLVVSPVFGPLPPTVVYALPPGTVERRWTISPPKSHERSGTSWGHIR